MLSGHMAITVDRGAGPRRVLEWRSGDVSGLVHRRVPVGVRRSQAVDEQHPQPAAPLSITDSAAFAFSEAVRVRAA
ncbi:MAG TPA: hypothetical protein EYQ27_16965 [Gemmatimonadetes bacterium]|nr:hypothetical protein [Gemmatimonadota bacterium]